MWRKISKYRTLPTLAPPTPTAAVDGSRYFPPRLENVGKSQPGVPQSARLKSAKRFVKALEERRMQSMSPQVKSNPLCHISALIERLPIVQQPLKSWQVDFAAIQVRAMDEIESKLPPSIIKQQWEDNPPWSLEAFKDYFGKHAEALTPFLSPPKADVADAGGAAGKQDDASGSGKKQKQGKKGAKEGKKQEPAAAAVVAKQIEATKAGGAEVPAGPAGWEKAMANMGIEFAESAVDDEGAKAMTLHVDLKSKKDDRLVDFVVEPRITEADKKNDTKSLDRKLWNKLYLVVKRKGKWGFPSVTRTDKESILEATRRAAFSVFDEDSRAHDLFFASSCPMGYRPASNAKEFFLRVQLLHGGMFNRSMCKDPVEDYAWLAPNEIADLFYGKERSQDEHQYMVRMFGDDWWEDPRDGPELGPVEDDVAKKPLKKLSGSVIRKRVLEEETRRAELEQKALAAVAAGSSQRA